MPDDAGGFFHVASGSPEGKDMAGMICESPVDLSDGWWLCGMKL
ncbi:hypothetical protein [Nocardioides flavescens]|nr:hypothetical protein [Nocardioides flavescens]